MTLYNALRSTQIPPQFQPIQWLQIISWWNAFSPVLLIFFETLRHQNIILVSILKTSTLITRMITQGVRRRLTFWAFSMHFYKNSTFQKAKSSNHLPARSVIPSNVFKRSKKSNFKIHYLDQSGHLHPRFSGGRAGGGCRTDSVVCPPLSFLQLHRCRQPAVLAGALCNRSHCLFWVMTKRKWYYIEELVRRRVSQRSNGQCVSTFALIRSIGATILVVGTRNSDAPSPIDLGGPR